MKQLLRNPLNLAFITILFFAIAFSFLHRWTGEDQNGWEATIDGDSKGYYAFLPAYFIYDDLSFEFFNKAGNENLKRYYHPRFRILTENGTVNKNYIGVALLIAPFFLSAHLLTELSGGDANGYSWPYILAVIVAAIFYMMIGLFFLSRTMRSYRIPDRITAIVILVIALGTNLFYYTTIHSAMAHVYAFFCICLFTYYSRIFFLNNNKTDFLIATLFIGILTIVRPMNLIVIAALPFLAGSWNDLKHTFYFLIRKPLILFTGLLLFLMIISLQLLVFNMQVGNWFVWSYGNEGFNFSQPEISNVLFSFRKGLFVYSPILFFIFPGIIYLFKKSSYEGICFTLFLLVLTYVLSSWWNWFYGDGFGMRAFIDFYGLFAIALSTYFYSIHNRIMKSILYFIAIVLIFYNMFQTYQYRYQIIHPDSMNFEKYKYVFLKTSEKYRNILGGSKDVIHEPIDESPFFLFRLLLTENEQIWTGDKTGNENFSEIEFRKGEEFGKGLVLKHADISEVHGRMYVQADLMRLQHTPNACDETYLVCSIEDSTGNVLYWNGIKVNEVPSNKTEEWVSRDFGFLLPDVFREETILKIYIWNKEKQLFKIKSFSISFHKVLEKQ